jgi:hypothetical protein
LPNASSSHRRSFSSHPSNALWAGTTPPHENQKVPSAHAGTGISIPSPTSESERIERQHYAHVQRLLNLTAASVSGIESSTDSRPKSGSPRSRSHSLSEPPIFRTDGPLTPYPIELDSGQKFEPTHATSVKVMDRKGEEHSIVVAEVEGDGGRRKRVLLAVDLEDYQKDDGEATLARRVRADEVFQATDLRPPATKS